jgi:hypothetical protein
MLLVIKMKERGRRRLYIAGEFSDTVRSQFLFNKHIFDPRNPDTLPGRVLLIFLKGAVVHESEFLSIVRKPVKLSFS